MITYSRKGEKKKKKGTILKLINDQKEIRRSRMKKQSREEGQLRTPNPSNRNPTRLRSS